MQEKVVVEDDDVEAPVHPLRLRTQLPEILVLDSGPCQGVDERVGTVFGEEGVVNLSGKIQKYLVKMAENFNLLLFEPFSDTKRGKIEISTFGTFFKTKCRLNFGAN